MSCQLLHLCASDCSGSCWQKICSAANCMDACGPGLRAHAFCVQGRPSLVFGDTVYLRVADNPAEEVAAALVSQKGTQALLAVPRGFFSMVEVRPADAPYPVVILC